MIYRGLINSDSRCAISSASSPEYVTWMLV